MNVIIDRFEGNYAVCEKEDRTMIDIKKSKIPSIAKEGDVLSIDNDVIIIDIEKTKKRLNEIQKLTKGLWE
ncbi:DUF3006 domain-containing protein [Clostridium estertheticum]|uniref:Pyruvate kinase n=1 Tax=Clostridium estertheticum subsp. estertheticum TaxID=1552 RepID=A0A1J0GFQ5_9CLOT|nr:DUF3006 domain-containing protein [Clostridium estertheticum]APC40212.1 pyruvate kinase [Clostridium estertheticum subsp. estertheticum]MBU3075223.1 DUF3006 domain-containing protein [Clostridium estertheticum]MBU3165438.1 DUF3006 domain-containing protein [Clostridium estertheticum]MBU3170444.1 DUF3006 domain-containing protein [Clostridium estertheticum]MBU3186954.1 DUF3006 domain-containing protein [Clostridium estertheticum]